MTRIRRIMWICLLVAVSCECFGQRKQELSDSVVLSNDHVRVVLDKRSGMVNYYFSSGSYFENTVAWLEDQKEGKLVSIDFKKHDYTIDEINDPIGKGSCLNVVHEDEGKAIRLIQ